MIFELPGRRFLIGGVFLYQMVLLMRKLVLAVAAILPVICAGGDSARASYYYACINKIPPANCNNGADLVASGWTAKTSKYRNCTGSAGSPESFDVEYLCSSTVFYIAGETGYPSATPGGYCWCRIVALDGISVAAQWVGMISIGTVDGGISAEACERSSNGTSVCNYYCSHMCSASYIDPETGVRTCIGAVGLFNALQY
jgi:hypothetical protein